MRWAKDNIGITDLSLCTLLSWIRAFDQALDLRTPAGAEVLPLGATCESMRDQHHLYSSN